MAVELDAYSTAVTGGTGGAPAITIGSKANLLVAWVSVQGTATTITASVGGVPMTVLTAVTSGSYTLRTFVLQNPPTGNQTVSFTGISGIATYCVSAAVSYKNVGSVGTLITGTNTDTIASILAPSIDGQRAVNAFMTIGNMSAYDKNLLGSKSQAAFVNQGFCFGEAPGKPALGFNAALASSMLWLGSALILSPMPGLRTFFKGYGVPTAPASGTYFSDDFNRASLGSNWTNRLTPTTAINVRIANSNALGVSGAYNYGFATYYQDFTSDNVKVTVTIGPDAVSADYYIIGLRGNGTQIVYAYVPAANTPQIMTHSAAGGDWRNMVDNGQIVRATGPASVTHVAGDRISFEARGNIYTVKRNDVTIVKWNDSGGTLWNANVDASHRQWGIGLGTTGTTTRGMIDSVTGVTVGSPPTPPFSDDFSSINNNIFVDDNWQTWTAYPVRTMSGRAEASANNNWTIASYNWPVLTDNHKISAVWVTPNVNFASLLYVRGNNTNQIIGFVIDTGNASAIYANSNVWGGPGGTIYNQAVVDWANGDTASLEAIGNTYVLRKNGVAQAIWNDAGGSVWSANVNASHREVGIGFINNSGTASGWDSIVADDLPSGYFLPSQMTKSGTLAWATSATWADITTWTALNDTVNTSLLAAPGLTVLTTRTGAVLYAAIPYTGSTAGRQHTIRIMRVSDSAVIATGVTTTDAAGLCTVVVNQNITAEEVYKVQMNSNGASAGTITATTPYFSISDKRAYSYTWSGTVMGPFPSGNVWRGALSGTMTPGDMTVASGIASETNPTGTSNDGAYFSGRTIQDPLNSNLHWAEATHANTAGGSWFPRAVGVGVGGSDASFTNGVFAVGAAFPSGGVGQEGTQILTKIGGTLTVRAVTTVGWNTGDQLRLVVTNNGANYVYTVYKNGTTQIVQWTDASNVVTPGNWTAPAFGCSWNSGQRYGSHGATAFKTTES